jgi:hypothetical protein
MLREPLVPSIASRRACGVCRPPELIRCGGSTLTSSVSVVPPPT